MTISEKLEKAAKLLEPILGSAEVKGPLAYGANVLNSYQLILDSVKELQSTQKKEFSPEVVP